MRLPGHAEGMVNRSFGILAHPEGWKKWCGSGLVL
jgi:hypothetical protein